jgi:hypothetical protein
MVSELRREDFGPSSPGGVDRLQGLRAVTAGWRQQRWHKKQEIEWEHHLRNLQQCVADLLLKNQLLRNSLTSARNQDRKGNCL